jgi:hypothetical protein
LIIAILALLSVACSERLQAQALAPARTFTIESRIEPIGPSSRRTALVISEIMYHPPENAEGVELEYIELYNSRSVSEDISGFRISGDIDYVFPSGSIIEKRSYLVISSDPEALERAYGITGVLGSYVNNLDNGNGLVRLRNRSGAILLEVNYADEEPWPIAADGAGHSLVLRRPSYGEGNVKAWAASNLKGGSPGASETEDLDALVNIKMNEFLANTREPEIDFIELYNHSNVEVDLSGAYLSDSPRLLKFQLPVGSVIAPGGFLSFNQNEFGFNIDSGGEALYLVNPDNTRVIDACRFQAQVRGVSTGRIPDGATAWHELAAVTPGEANSEMLIREIVINELMYNPISGLNDDEYIELYNQSAEEIDLSDWRFIDGVSFQFPAETIIGPHKYLVVAKNKARLLSKYDGLQPSDVVGDYGGQLSNAGERLVLARPSDQEAGELAAEQNMIVVDEVTYADGGKWGKWSNRGGSSMELIDPRSDNRLADNWADSDETEKAPWVDIEHSGILEEGIGNPDELDLMLLGAGEVLIDNLEVVSDTGDNIVANPTFEHSIRPLFAQGNHVRSDHNDLEGFESSGSLHLRASGGGDNGANRLELQISNPREPALNPGETINIRAKARWLMGHTNLLFRIQGNYFEGVTSLEAPANLGTPGQQNSRFKVNTGPALYDVTHNPVNPRASKLVTITARAHDPDGMASMELRYRVDPSESYLTLPMNDAGLDGDEVARDGVYSAVIPGQAKDSIVAYHIQATDLHQSAQSNQFPAKAPHQEALIRYGIPQFAPYFGNYHLIITRANSSAWRHREALSNEPVDGTFVYNDCRVIYNIGTRYRGSPFIRRSYSNPLTGIAAYIWTMPRDDKFLGARELNLDSLEQASGRDATLQRERMSFWIADKLGLQFCHQRYIKMYVNGRLMGKVYADVQQPNSDYIDAWFPDTDSGEMYKIDDWFEFDDSFGFSNVNATLQNFTKANGEKNQARYRWNWEKKSNKGLDDDYSNLFQLVEALNAQSPSYRHRIETLVDAEQWMRVFALRHIVGDWDGYGYRRGKNQFAYKPVDGRWQMVLWDLDFSLGGDSGLSSDSPQHSLFDVNDPIIGRMYNYPQFFRAYIRTLQEAVNGPLLRENYEPIMQANFSAFMDNGIRGAATPNRIGTWIDARRNYINSVLDQLKVNFSITTNDGQAFTSSENYVTLQGLAPIAIDTLEVNGNPVVPKWNNGLEWETTVVLNPGENVVAIQGLDRQGQLVSEALAEIRITCTSAVVQAEDHLVISEIMYHPNDAEAEYVEITNTSQTHAFSLANYEMEGVEHVFGSGMIIKPAEQVIISRDAVAFYSAYEFVGERIWEYQGRLNDQGETLRLIWKGSNQEPNKLIDQVSYAAEAPWPLNAAGMGAALQLVDPAQDNDRVINWMTVDPEIKWRQVIVSGVATSSTLLIHHAPYIPRPDLDDITGQWVGAINIGEGLNFSVDFSSTGADEWTGEMVILDDGSHYALTVTYNNPAVIFRLQVDSNVIWSGTLANDGNSINGNFSQPGFGGASFSMQRVSASKVAEVFIDDLELRQISPAGLGPNLISEGEFEAPLSRSWEIAENHQGTSVTTTISHTGNSSLQLLGRRGGHDKSTAVWRELPVELGQVYRLSYWYYPGRNSDQLMITLEDGSIHNGAHNVKPMNAFTPGAPNNIAEVLAPLPAVWINEIQPQNTGAWVDSNGDHDAWVELYNAGSTTLDLTGFYLSNDYADLGKWAFPVETTIAPGAFLMVCLDGDVTQSVGGELHSNFMIDPNQGRLALTRMDRNSISVIDYLNYAALTPGASIGLYPDGIKPPNHFEYPTPAAHNVLSQPELKVYINEWMARNNTSLVDPSDGNYEDWFELYNASAVAVDLTQFTLTDNLLNPRKYVIPPGWIIPARGYLLVWADNDSQDTSAMGLHVNFRLNAAGEELGLFAPDGTLVDSITFARQSADHSQGRWPDGSQQILTFSQGVTPAASNDSDSPVIGPTIDIALLSVGADGGVTLSWNSEIGVSYVVQYKVSLEEMDWLDLAQITAPGELTTFTDESIGNTQRFYRVLAQPWP